MVSVLQQKTVVTSTDVGEPWRGFRGDGWRTTVDPRAFLQANYTRYGATTCRC